eukprot:6194356-Pleurochrysis_carterae.AAC.7
MLRCTERSIDCSCLRCLGSRSRRRGGAVTAAPPPVGGEGGAQRAVHGAHRCSKARRLHPTHETRNQHLGISTRPLREVQPRRCI